MKKTIITALFLSMAAVNMSAQLLYKISGKGLAAPSYIVGTYHLAPSSFADSIPGMRKAMADCQQTYGELVTSQMISADSTAMLQQAMDAVYKYQDKESGAWYDVLDVKDPRNYLESTASAMFTYVMLKGARLGYLDESYKEKGKKAYEALLKNFIRIDTPTPSSGIPTISLTKCCSVSGLGPESNPKRDGSFEYYMSEPIRDNDAKGIGPFIWAALEMENIEN